jgi:hypothetical protein
VSPNTDASLEFSMLRERFGETKQDLKTALAGHLFSVRDQDLCQLHSRALVDLLDGMSAQLQDRENVRSELKEMHIADAKERKEAFWKTVSLAAIFSGVVVALLNLILK